MTNLRADWKAYLCFPTCIMNIFRAMPETGLRCFPIMTPVCIFTAGIFVCGNLPAGSPLNMLEEMENHEPEEADPAILEMACNTCAALKSAADYLIYGEMLPTDELPVPRMNIWIRGLDFGFERKIISVPCVLCMFWKNPEGRTACALANVSDETKNRRKYRVGQYIRHARRVFIETNGCGKIHQAEVVEGKTVLEIPARSAVVVREER